MYSVSLRRKSPRKLDRLKCENCRQAKKKCKTTELGCERCDDKEVDCPGRTKAGASSKKPTLSLQKGDTKPLSSSFIETQNERWNSSGLNTSNCVEPETVPTEPSQSDKRTTTPDSLSEQIAHAMEEIDGLETGMDLVDCMSVNNDDGEGLSPESPAFKSLTVLEISRFLRSCQKKYMEFVLFKGRNPSPFDGIPRPFDVSTCGILRYCYFPGCGDGGPKSMYETPESFNEFIGSFSQIQYGCDGNFVCTRQPCNLRPFEASWEALEDHYYKYHAVDMIGVSPICIFSNIVWSQTYLRSRHEEFDVRVRRATMSEEGWASWKYNTMWPTKAITLLRPRRFEVDLDCHKIISQTRQFQDLRSLKNAFHARYTHFLRTSESSPELSVFATELRTYRHSRGLHRLGFSVFRKVLAGTAPSTVLEVFAFELLSGAMADVMRNVWKKEISHQPKAIDYLVWRSEIKDAGGRDLFDHLLDKWFPYFMLPEDSSLPLVSSSAEVMRYYILDLVDSIKTTGPPNFSAFSSPEISRSILGTGDSAREIDCGQFDSLWGIKSAGWQGAALQVGPKLITVWDSIVFMLAYLFMIYVTERGILVIYLGNRDRQCDLLGLKATAGSILQVSERLKREVIDPLLMEFSGSPEIPKQLKAAMVMIDCGHIWAVEHLSGPLKVAVDDAIRVTIKDPELLSKWLTEVDLKCWLAKASIVPAWLL